MRILRLTIERFRGVEDLVLFPSARTVLLGPNNAGKSTVLEALDLLMHPGSGRPRPAPTEIDYFDRDTSREFRIEAVLGGLDVAFAAEAHEAIEGWVAAERRITPEPDGDGITPVVRIEVRGTADLDLVHSYAKPEMAGARLSRATRARFGWVFDGRTRDPTRQLAFYQGGLLDQLFAGLNLDAAIEALRDALGGGASQVNADAVVAAELAAVESDLKALGLITTGAAEFEAGAVTARELLQALRLAMPGHGTKLIPIVRHGRGTQRLLVLAILLRIARSRRGPLIGAFEEPEEALEPVRQGQAARMLAEVADAGGQVFLTTHSPDIVRGFDLGDLVLLEPTPNTKAIALADALAGAAHHGLERRADGPIVRALFARFPVVVEGPSDAPVLEAMWRALSVDGAVPPMDHLGMDVVNAEGITMMPMALRILHEAGKSTVALVERDDPRSDAILNGGHVGFSVVYQRDASRNNLERLLAQTYSVPALASGMTAVAQDRGDDLAAQLAEIKQRAGDANITLGDWALLDRAQDVEAALGHFTESDARTIVALCLGAKKPPCPFEIKGRRAARVFAETVTSREGVPEPYRSALIKLGSWVSDVAPRNPDTASL